MNPKDIFKYMEIQIRKEGYTFDFSFSKARVQAEQNLLKKNWNPNISEIYGELQEVTGITADEKTYLINKELETELAFIKPRMAMLRLFNEIKDKRIFLVSDMYLPKDVLSHILNSNGYDGYTDIIVSCDYKKGKKKGLFSELQAKTEKADRILHIGDDYSADIEPLKESGVDTFFIMSEREMLANSSYGKILDHLEYVKDMIFAGEFVNNAFDDPFEMYKTKGRMQIRSLEQYTALFIAPVVFNYCAWIIKRVIDTGCTYILYTSRDGYLIQKIIEIIKEKYHEECIPNGEYFYASRRACLAANVYDYEDIKTRLYFPFKGDIYSLFFERFGINIDEKAKEQDSDNTEQVLRYSQAYAEKILDHCKKERENYLSYIKHCGIERHEKIAVIDLVAKGTIQNELAKLLAGHRLVGMYFFKTNSEFGKAVSDMEFCSMYEPKGKYCPDCPNVYRSYRQLEFVFTSPEPTFQAIDDNGNKKFMKELRSQKQIKDVKFMQHIIIKYVENMVKLLEFQQIMEINETIVDMLLGFTDSQYSKFSFHELSEMVLYSELENLKFTVTENL